VADLLAALDIQPPPPSFEVMPAPDGWFEDAPLDSPAIYDLRLQVERLRVTQGFDRLICLDDISVDHYQHQLDAALRALRDMRGRTLLADEVGLGKTIEAGIVMKELVERGLAESVLIVVPAPLTWQWHEEMLTKFHEDFVVLEDLEQLAPYLSPAAPALTSVLPQPGVREFGRCRWIISLDRAKTPSWSQPLLAREYDLLIVDEVHKLKNHRTQAYRFVDSLRKRFVLMLTATPVHNDLMELYNLVTILRPGHLGTRRVFRRNFVASGPRHRVVTWSTQTRTGVSSYVNNSPPGKPSSLAGFRVQTVTDLAVEALAPPSLLAGKGRDWARQVTSQDRENFAQARGQLAALLRQGYQVERAWIVSHKKGGIYGFRVEMIQAIETALEAGQLLAAAVRRPVQRTVYSDEYVLAGYLRKNPAARQAQREAGAHHILRRSEDLAELGRLPGLNQPGRQAVAEVKQLLAQGYQVVDFEAIEWRGRWGRRRADFVCHLSLKPTASQGNSGRPSSEHHTTPRNSLALRGLLREVMIRNRRSGVGVRFPPRQAAVYYLNLTPPERELYDGVTGYIRQQLQTVSEEGSQPAAGHLRLTLMTLQKELCSSPQAVARTLDKLLARGPDPRLADYLALAQSVDQGRKLAATQIILEQYPGKFLIFTDYLPTLYALRAALDQAGHETVIFYGGMSAYERVEAVRAFRQSARVMISTQSGGEGHNLQFCHQMINYDLPWNPMRIEQRIGRIHRLGQTHQVSIFNLSATQTIEAYVLDLLARKIRMFELVIGELDLILGALDEQRGFEDYIQEAWAGSHSEAELLRKIAELETILDHARTSYEQIRVTSDELSGLIGE
jgi:superfamily II DNA or RNA helicase